MWISRVSAGLRLVGSVALAGCLTGVAGAQAPAPAGESRTMVTMPPIPLLLAHAADLTATETHSGTVPEAFNGAFCAPGANAPGPMATSAAGAGTASPDCKALMKEAGLTRYATAIYTRAGAGPVPAFAYEFGDATGAYSAYTFLRAGLKGGRVTDGDARDGKAHETTTDADGALVWAGTAVLRLEARASAPELNALAAALPKVGGRAGLAPLLPTLQPGNGREKGTERYAIGPVGYAAMGGVVPAELLGWQKSAEVLSSRYGAGTVTLMLYPTPQIAGERGRAIEAYINQAVQQSGAGQFGTVKMRRLGPLVGMTTGGLSAGHAKDLLDSLRLNQQVTFDKPMPLEFHAEMKKTYSLMQSIALFCGLGLVACVLLGLFLGAGRAGIRILQGKPAAVEPEFLTINLRGEAKGVLLDHRADGTEIPR